MAKFELYGAGIHLLSAVHDGQLTSGGHVPPHSEILPVQDQSRITHLAHNRVYAPQIGRRFAQHEHAVAIDIVLLHDPQVPHGVFVDEWRQEKVT